MSFILLNFIQHKYCSLNFTLHNVYFVYDNTSCILFLLFDWLKRLRINWARVKQHFKFLIMQTILEHLHGRYVKLLNLIHMQNSTSPMTRFSKLIVNVKLHKLALPSHMPSCELEYNMN